MLCCALVLLVLMRGAVSLQPRGLLTAAAQLGEFPFIVSLEVSERHYCAASVISQDSVLTAAQCVQRSDVREKMVIRAGDVTLHHPDKVVWHPAFDNYSMFDSDIAVIKVKEAFSMEPVRLEKKLSVPTDGSQVLVTGWSTTSSAGDGSQLTSAPLRVVSNAQCNSMPAIQRLHSQVLRPLVVNDNMLCAVANQRDATQNDVGAPLLHGKQPLLVGIASWGPGVYVKAASFIRWIYLQTVSLPSLTV